MSELAQAVEAEYPQEHLVYKEFVLGDPPNGEQAVQAALDMEQTLVSNPKHIRRRGVNQNWSTPAVEAPITDEAELDRMFGDDEEGKIAYTRKEHQVRAKAIEEYLLSLKPVQAEQFRSLVRGMLRQGQPINVMASYERYLKSLTFGCSDQPDSCVPKLMRRGRSLLQGAVSHPDMFFDESDVQPNSNRLVEAALFRTMGSPERRQKQREQRRTELYRLLYGMGILGAGEEVKLTQIELVPAGEEDNPHRKFDINNFGFIAQWTAYNSDQVTPTPEGLRQEVPAA